MPSTPSCPEMMGGGTPRTRDASAPVGPEQYVCGAVARSSHRPSADNRTLFLAFRDARDSGMIDPFDFSVERNGMLQKFEPSFLLPGKSFLT